MYKIRCDCGLCDRLRVIFSYLHFANSTNQKLEVCWIVNDACNGHFLDIFEPVPNVTFTEDTSEVDYRGSNWHTQFDPERIFLYNQLKIKNNVLVIIKNNLKILGKNYIAVHIRRTDQVIFHDYSDMTSYEDFSKFIEENYNIEKVFLATDNAESQNWFLEKYREKIVVTSKIIPSTNLRQTSLEIAAADLFTCVYSKKFMGTDCSGYTNFINWYRNTKWPLFA
jgi:hypothetical protein